MEEKDDQYQLLIKRSSGETEPRDTVRKNQLDARKEKLQDKERREPDRITRLE